MSFLILKLTQRQGCVNRGVIAVENPVDQYPQINPSLFRYLLTSYVVLRRSSRMIAWIALTFSSVRSVTWPTFCSTFYFFWKRKTTQTLDFYNLNISIVYVLVFRARSKTLGRFVTTTCDFSSDMNGALYASSARTRYYKNSFHLNISSISFGYPLVFDRTKHQMDGSFSVRSWFGTQRFLFLLVRGEFILWFL